MSKKRPNTNTFVETPVVTPVVAPAPVADPVDTPVVDVVDTAPVPEPEAGVDSASDTVAPDATPAPEPTPEPEPAAEPTPAPVPEPEVVVAEPTVYDFLMQRHRGFKPEHQSALLKDIVDSLERYVAAMSPLAPIDPANGRMYQQLLYTTFLKAIGAPNGEHRLALDIITWYIHRNNNAAFADRYSGRFFDILKLSKEARMCFEAMLNLFVITADFSTRREALKRLNMRTAIQTLPTLRYQQQLLDYYTGF